MFDFRFSSKFIKNGHLSIPNSLQESAFRDFSREMAEDMVREDEAMEGIGWKGGGEGW